jgi:hypothetical protein
MYTLYKGFYSKSLTSTLQKKIGKAAIVHIDCDLFLSTKEVLIFLKPLLQQGTIVIFDDFYHYKGDIKKGENAALRDFLATNKQVDFISYYNHSYSGKSFIVNLRSD